MMKKFAIILVIFIVAFLSFGYVQMEKMRTQLVAILAENNIIFSKVELDLFPIPSVVIHSPKFFYKKEVISFNTAKFHLSIPLLLSAQLAVKDIILSGGNDPLYNIQNLDISLSKAELSVNDAITIFNEIKNDKFLNRTLIEKEFDLDIHFQSNENRRNHLSSHIILNKTIDFSDFYFTHSLENGDKQIVLKINQGKIEKESQSSYLLWIDDLWVNEGHFVDVITRLKLFENDHLHYNLATKSRDNYINMNIYQQNENKQFFDIGIFSSIEVSELLKSFKFPVMLSGKTNLNAHFTTKSLDILSGNYQLLSKNGTLHGMNLFSMVSQYLPINYDGETLKNKAIDTAFHRFYLNGDYKNKIFSFTEIILDTDDFIAQGGGTSSLIDGECDINLNLGLNGKKYIEYSTLKLPVRFWGQCSNPQYKFMINKSLLNQLKPLLLKKLFKH